MTLGTPSVHFAPAEYEYADRVIDFVISMTFVALAIVGWARYMG